MFDRREDRKVFVAACKWYEEYFVQHNFHYNDVIIDAMASQITILTIIYSTGYSDADQRKHQSSASLAFVNSPQKWPVTRKMFPFDDVIMRYVSLG